VTKRKKKLLTIQILLFSLATILIFFTYYGKNDNKFDNKKTKTETKPIEKDADDKTTSFENIEYKGVDLEGNRYIIKSELADFSLENPELINMRIMSAIFYLKDGSILKIKGDWGSYNNQTYDMKFRENIETKYKDNFIYSEKLDYLNSKQLLTVSGNVKTKSLQGNIEADRLLFDLSLNTLDISMFDENQVKVKMKNK
tara:strand:- start:92 stop:688 length:597 start_codon:yes stop_codon:yes gene_type:complete